MQIKYIGSAILLALSATFHLGANAGPVGPELIVNGGFEANTGANPTGWTFTAAANGSRAGAEPLGEHTGSNAFFFGSSGDYDHLSQTIATEAFTEYVVEAWIQVDNFITQTDINNSLNALFGPYNFFLVQDVGSKSSSYLMTKTMLALGPTTTIEFGGANKNGNFYLDDVSVRQVGAANAVPEPGTYTLIGAGLVALCLSRRCNGRAHLQQFKTRL